jgi:hypothetical protein
MNSKFLPLTEYSNKYRVSISTLRRRIKADDIQFVFEDGKYLILDGPLSTHQRVHRPSPIKSEETLVGAQHKLFQSSITAQIDGGVTAAMNGGLNPQAPGLSSASVNPPARDLDNKEENSVDSDSVLLFANNLLNELKKAYSQILHEKEEQILHLKSELSDLKTLVKVLESEHERISKNQK